MKKILLIFMIYIISFSYACANDYSEVSEHKYQITIGNWKITKILSVFGDIEELRATQSVNNGYGYNFTMCLEYEKHIKNKKIEITFLTDDVFLIQNRAHINRINDRLEYAIDDDKKSIYNPKTGEGTKEFLQLLYNKKRLFIRFNRYNQGIFDLEWLEKVVKIIESDSDKLVK